MCFGNRESKSMGAARSRDIDLVIRKDEKRMKKEVKLLLLGAAESGKTTVLKQMRLIYCKGFDKKERLEWRPIILGNLIQSFRVIFQIMSELKYELDSQDNEESMAYMNENPDIDLDNGMPSGYLEPIKALWRDSGVEAAVAQGHKYGLEDNLAYFMNNIDCISADGYVPDNQDILRSRMRTTGVHESVFDLGRWTYRMIDVGGQRSERKKWIHCFQKVNCLLFLVAISGYDHCLLDGRDSTQMDEAFVLWESIVNSYWFTDSAIILFLNKMDLFVEKLPCKPIAKHGFPDYKGPADDYQAASEHILDRFRALSHDPDKQIYGHFTNATDTDLLKITMESVQETIIQRNLNLLVLA